MKIHMVKKGDTLYEIAKKYNVDLDKLIAINPQIADPDVIEVGMKVKIPNAPKPVVPPTDYLYKHVVVQGDTLWKLGKAWNVPLQGMIEANPQLKNPNVLMTGEIVYIPKLKVQPTPPQHQPYAHPYTIPNAVPAVPEVPIPVAPPQLMGISESVMTPEAQLPAAQFPPMPEAAPNMPLTQEPYTDLFQQYHVPAAEVASYDYEAWAAPQLPPMPEMPSADSMPYEGYAAAMPAYPLYPQQPVFNDCGCGGPVYPAYEQGIPYPYAPNMEQPLAEHLAYAHPGSFYPYPNMMHPGANAPYFPVPYDAMALTSAYAGPVYPMHAYPAFPAYESPFVGGVKKDCGCHDRANEQVKLQAEAEPEAAISQKPEKAKVKSTKSKTNSAQDAVRKLVQRSRRKASSTKGKSQHRPWING